MAEIWKIILEVLEYFSIFNKVTGLALFLTSVFLFVRFFGFKYKKPILYIFKKNSLFGLFLMSKITISFRKNPIVLTRMFCEYLIINNHNQKLSHGNLRMYHKIFLQNYVKKDYDSIDIKSTFDAIKVYSSPFMKRYFSFFKDEKNMRKYDINTREPLSFLLLIMIEKGYLLPAISLPGLQDHYNDDWSLITNRYFKNAKSTENTSELFMFYTWLMWGPSYMPNYRRRDYKLVQYGMGDESKTFNVFLNVSDKAIKLWDQIKESIEDYGYGMQCGLKLKVYEKQSYIENNNNMFGNEVSPFLNKIVESDKPIILEHVSHSVSISGAEDSKYFSAYIWALFVKTENNVVDEKFGINNCIAFFEHANIAENSNYDYLFKALVNKMLLHFEINYKTCSEKYYLNNTLNEDIYIKIKDEFNKRTKIEDEFGLWLQKHIIFNKIITIGTLLGRFDEEFSMNKQNMSFHEIKAGCNKSMELLSRFYVSIYLNNFPDENERETLDNFIQYLNNEKEGKNGRNHYHILICTIEGEIAGGIISDYFEEINSAVFEFIVVNEKYRRKHVGARLIDEMTNILNNDSNKYNHNNVDYIFIETENPTEVHDEIKSKATQTVEFWRRQRFLAIDFKYIQPSIGSGKQAVEHLFLAVKLCKPSLDEKTIKSSLLKKFLSFYAKYAMSIEDPDKDEIILMNYTNLFEDEVELKYIDEYLKVLIK